MKKITKYGNQYLSWVLRILLIIMILLFAMFSVDVFEEEGFWNIILGLLMHNIPTFIMIFILIVAWKKENIGGVLLMIGVVSFAIFLTGQLDTFMWGTVFKLGIPFLISVLFVVNHYFIGKSKPGNGE